MLNTILDAAKIGLGAIWLSKENLKKVTDNLAEIGKVSKEEGDRLLNELQSAGEEHRKKLAEMVDSSVKKAMDQAGLATKSEVEELKRKVDELNEALGKMGTGGA
ncbi:MAG: phasin family protein [Nitrospinae bacterium]|nr:phasin family protein [Nitrospinota bacterium]